MALLRRPPTMPTPTEDSDFLSRWSRRKAQMRQGAELAEARPASRPLVTPVAPRAPATVGEATTAAGSAAVQPQRSALGLADAAGPDTNEPTHPAQAHPPTEPPPTLADVAALTRDSDFSRFVGRSVQPDVKNAALAKLFADPHFNVMDGLDTYIDDYSKPDPLPPGLLRQLVQSDVLGLFDDEGRTSNQEGGQHQAESPTPLAATTANAAPDLAPAPEAALTNPPPGDENTALQLQPDDDAGRTGAANSAEENTRRAH
jgi:hypothetical protein